MKVSDTAGQQTQAEPQATDPVIYDDELSEAERLEAEAEVFRVFHPTAPVGERFNYN